MSTIFYNDGFEVTPELKRQSKLTIYVVFPIMFIFTAGWSILFIMFCYEKEYISMDPPLFGVQNLSQVIITVFICVVDYMLIPLLGGTLMTWFKVRRSNLVHAVVESLNNGKGLDRSFFNDRLKDRDHFFRADNEKLEIRYELPLNYLKYMILITMIPLAIFYCTCLLIQLVILILICLSSFRHAFALHFTICA